MSRWKLKRKRWLDRHSRVKKNRRNKRKNRLYILPDSVASVEIENHRKRYNLVAPACFSFVENPEGTMKFIDDFVKLVKSNTFIMHIHIDSINVDRVTVDALIYLLAVMDNNQSKFHLYSGSFPKDEDAKKVYIDSGFTKFVSTTNKLHKVFPQDTDRMRIERGNENDPKAAKKICDFVRESLSYRQKNNTQELYKVLIELFSNAYWHAYDSDLVGILSNLVICQPNFSKVFEAKP